jgi:putative PIN family toxin of toxin-antitoxin system
MIIVIDTNIMFSALLKENNKLRDIILSKENHIYAPSKMLDELLSHFDKVLKYTKIDKTKFFSFYFELIKDIDFIDDNIIPNEIYQTAYHLCCEYDEDDTPFVALALYLDAKLFTGDKIKEHLLKKGFKNLY